MKKQSVLRITSISAIALIAIIFSACSLFKSLDLGRANLFPIDQDKELGLQVKQEIEANPQEYNVMKRSEYPEAYQHLDRMMSAILNSGELKYKDEFAWEAYLIKDDETLNAFCTPGGYIYVYTGLIKFLDNESDLAGVLGHEIAHADRRHSTQQLTKLYGVEILSQLALGQASSTTIAAVAKSLAQLKFSRAHETDADNHSVKYLCPTEYPADGAAAFFEKLIDQNMAGGTPEFLSTHPSPDNRVENIKAQRKSLTCNGTNEFTSRYAKFKAALP
ncbi:MAG: M48 family metalloprotease [Bacteroidetes bacterium]|nr:M48 family metalloprotease [Bacteroidota bacterium]